MSAFEIPDNQHEDLPGNPTTALNDSATLRQEATEDTLSVLTMEQWKFWKQNGYVVVKNAISRQQAEETATFLWEFEEKEPDKPETWYTPARSDMQMKELVGTGMVEVYNHQHLWNNRQSQRVYDSFVDIWATKKLWVTIDRANLNFPMRPGHTYEGFIHWDYDPETKPQNVQGILALNDQIEENTGGFQCIPWLFRNYEDWKLTQPKERDHFKPNIKGLEEKIVKVPMEAGDLLIFNSLLPHGIRPNYSETQVRIAQYISMVPAQEHNGALRKWRINSWRKRIPPSGFAFPGDPRKWEQTKYNRAELTALGEKLLGLKNWY